MKKTSVSHSRSPRNAKALLATGAAALLVVVLAWAWNDPAPGPMVSPAAQPTQAPAGPTSGVKAADATQTRSEITPTAETPKATAPARSFQAAVRGMVAEAEAAQELAKAGQMEKAMALNEQTKTMFAAIFTDFDRVGDRSLEFAAELAANAEEKRDTLLAVLAMLLDGELQREDAAEARDRLVAATLAVLPLKSEYVGPPPVQGPPLDANGQIDGVAMLKLAQGTASKEYLVDNAFRRILSSGTLLHLPHEAAVQELVERAGRDEYPSASAAELKQALQRNLRELKEKSVQGLESQALLDLESTDAAVRAAALQELLKSERFRAALLAKIIAEENHELAREVCGKAVSVLGPLAAIDVLWEVRGLAGDQSGTWMLIGLTHGDEACTRYEQLLAANKEPKLRKQLLAAVGMGTSQQCIRTALLALENDRDLDVRLQALLSLSICAAAQHGEAAILRILDDPTLALSESDYDIVLGAVSNLKAKGQPEAVRRIATRLESAPLQPRHRTQLATLLN